HVWRARDRRLHLYPTRRSSDLRNVAIGYNVAPQHSDGDFNMFLGSNAGRESVSGSNNILIGYNVQKPFTTASDSLNIGDVIKGNLVDKVVEIEKLRLSNLPISDPAESGMLWNDNGTLKIST